MTSTNYILRHIQVLRLLLLLFIFSTAIQQKSKADNITKTGTMDATIAGNIVSSCSSGTYTWDIGFCDVIFSNATWEGVTATDDNEYYLKQDDQPRYNNGDCSTRKIPTSGCYYVINPDYEGTITINGYYNTNSEIDLYITCGTEASYTEENNSLVAVEPSSTSTSHSTALSYNSSKDYLIFPKANNNTYSYSYSFNVEAGKYYFIYSRKYLAPGISSINYTFDISNINSWDFKNNDWTSSIAQIKANSAFTEESDNYYTTNPSSTTYFNDIDMIAGLGFTGYLGLDWGYKHVYLDHYNGSITIPSLTSGKYIIISLSYSGDLGNIFTPTNALLVSATRISENEIKEIYQVTSDGDVTLSAATENNIWFYAINIRTSASITSKEDQEYTHLENCGSFTHVISNPNGISASDITVTSSDETIATVEYTSANSDNTELTYTVTPVSDGSFTLSFSYTGNKYYVADFTTSEFTNTKVYTYTISNEGVCTITGDGSIPEAETITGVPGITMSFGNGTDSWTVYNNTGGGYKTYIATVPDQNATLNEDAVPTSGTYLKFEPTVNGFLSVDGSFFNRHRIILTNEDGSIRDTIISANGATYGILTFKRALIKGYTYYLYNDGVGNTQYPFQLHGFSYTPAFVMNESDEYVTVDGTIMSSYERDGESVYYIEGITTTDNLSVIYSGEKTGNITFSSSNTSAATINASTGEISLTDPGENNQSQTTITATITATYNSSTITRIASYDLTVIHAPAYVVQSKFTPKVLNKVSDNPDYGDDNKYYTGPSGITMTYGGSTESYTSNKDGWGKASYDLVGHNNKAIDGFRYASQGQNNNAKDEELGLYDYNSGTFKQPCYGTYLKFEPTLSGELVVYLLQNGTIDEPTEDNTTTSVVWRPYYIVDEMGDPVEMTETTTKGTLRAPYTTTDVTWASHYDENAEHKTLIQNAWKALGTEGTTESIIALTDNGTTYAYMVLSKAYVKYKFNVVAGKTYFIFSNASKLGLAGYIFHATETMADYEAKDSIEMKETEGYIPDEEINNVCVKLTKTIHKGLWNDICLPFSVSESEFEKVFGEEAYVIDFDYLNEENNKLHFTHHYYKFIRAGRPCFIFVPGTAGEDLETPLLFDHVTIKTIDPADVVENDAAIYTLHGTYTANTDVPLNGYWLGYNNKDKYVKFLRITETTKANGGRKINAFKTYFTLNENISISEAKKYILADDMEEMEATGIRDITDIAEKTESGNIYTLQGQIIKADASSLDGLKKGIYIWKGRKYIVK